MFRKVFLFLIPFLIFSYYLVQGINLPYVGPNATNFSVYSLIAHNYNKFGYFETKLGNLISVSPKIPTNPTYFQHHPPLLSFIESILFRIFGESFWVGRLTVIIFSFGAYGLIYFIGKNLLNKKLGYILLLVTSIIPASTIFGKLIGQEPLVLFFVLLTLYSSLKFLKSGEKKYLIIGVISTILGTLSDWPMAIFSVCILPLFHKNKKLKKGLLLPLVSGIVVIILIIYFSWIMNGLGDLQFAVAHRSFTGLLELTFWPFYWLSAIALRAFIYFNPVVVLLSAIGIYKVYKNFKTKKLTNTHVVIFCLFLFGFLHLIFYTQASFTHPYLIHYLLPFIVFSSSLVILNLYEKKKYIILISISLFSLSYLFIIQNYKIKQTNSNIWKYETTAEVTKNLNKYEAIIINKDSALDGDMFWYPFEINVVVSANENPQKLVNKSRHYVYSCLNICWFENPELKFLFKNYSFKQIDTPQVQVFIFELNKSSAGIEPKEVTKKQSVYMQKDLETIRSYYRLIKTKLNIPQI